MRLLQRPIICDRVRSQISTLLDGEVSELDRRLVAAHIARCAECCSFETRVRAITDELRGAPLESPSEPIVLTRNRPQRRVWVAATQLGAAATVMIGVLGLVSEGGGPTAQANYNRLANANLFTASWSPELEMAQLDDSTAPTVRSTGRPGPLSPL